MKRAEIIARGEVQKVGYRDAVEKIAQQLDITGFVENLKPYYVKIVAEGEEDILNEFIFKIRIKKFPVSVKDLDIKFRAATGKFEYFEIKRGDWGEELRESMDIAGILLSKFVQLSNGLGEEMRKLDEDIGTLRSELIEEVREQISTLRQERLLLFEKEMLSDMHENFERYDSALQKTLEKFPYEKSVFIMMPFGKNSIRLRTITDAIKETLEEHGMHGWRADDPERAIMDNIWDNIIVNMLSCKYGIAVFVDRTVLDRYTDEQITVFNANIALEVGFMKSRGLDVLLLKDNRLEKLPTDIISKLYEEFDFEDPEGGVKKAVTEWIEKRQLGEMHK